MDGRRKLRAGVVAAAIWAAACIPDPPPDATPAAVKTAPDAGAQSDSALVADPKSLLATVDSMKEQLRNRPRDFSVDVALANLFYDNARYIEAIEYYTDAIDRAAETEKQLVGRPAAGSTARVPDGCRLDLPTKDDEKRGAKTRSFESVVALAASMAGTDPDGAAACERQLIPILAMVRARRGNSWYLIGNTEKARSDHAAALAIDPNDGEALFFSGALALETSQGAPSALAEGKAYWEKLLKVAPDHPRAALVRETLPRINELFGPKAQGGPEMAAAEPAPGGASAPMLPPGMADAMQKVQHTPEMDAELDKTTDEGEALLAKRDWQQALDTFKRVMPLRPSGRIALDMGIALRELGKPTAERVLMNAARMPDGDSGRARYELAQLYEKTNPPQARSLYQDLLSDPHVGSQARARLAAMP
jgi:tetratricopeptide (TPR) repeat protein